MTLIYHITSTQQIERAARIGKYVPENFDRDGFTHCAYINQLKSVVEARFRGRDDLAILEIDSSLLECPVIETDSGFPHVHGPLPLAAITSVREILATCGRVVSIPAVPGALAIGGAKE